ncbi:hypothetical protein EC991_009693 [Linnemannia zychae]|nr:hypothetical protein EC991_009693 [Linnemannia zychae]
MPFTPGSYVFCERRRISDICTDVDGIRIDHEEAVLEGYQIYLVEQWAIERNREVATAVSFTGDPVHQILVTTITIEHPNVVCPRLEKVFEKLRKEGAKPKEASDLTPYGQLFVTNLSLFASSLNIVLVPKQGDFDFYQQRFYLNLNLRRMGCSGRSALTSKSPSDAQREKFNQLYKISDSTDFEVTVLRLVVLVQNCLHIFGLFNLLDVDGLLCNATEKGLEQFYDTFLKSTLQKFPTPDNVLDPNVLAGMFSKLSNVRGKLQHLVNNVPKDPFADPVAFINAVKTFQIKKPDLKACFLDYKTVEAISAAYQSSFNPQGLKVHKVLKSKIEDFSGMTAVNPEGETTDLEVFAKHIATDSLKQVWKGKTKQKTDVADALANGDWLTGGKELGKSLVRGLAKTTRDTKNASQSLKSIAGGKNRQSLLLPKGKQGNPLTNFKEGTYTEDILIPPIAQEHTSPKSDDEKNEGCESDEGLASTVVQSSTTNLHTAPEEEAALAPTSESLQQPTSAAVMPSLDTLNALFSQKPEPRGQPEIAMEKDFSTQLESLKAILADRGKQFEEIEHEATEILAERRDLLAEVREKEHATQRSVYHLEGMVETPCALDGQTAGASIAVV